MPILEISLFKHHHKIGDVNRSFDEKFQEGSLVVQTSLETSQYHRFDWSHNGAVYPQERQVTIEFPETLATGYSEQVVFAVLTAVVGYLRKYLRHHNQWQGTEALILSDYHISNAAQPKTLKISPQMYELLSGEFIGARAPLPKLPDGWVVETLGEVVSGEGFDYQGGYDGVIQTQLLEHNDVQTHMWRVYDFGDWRFLNVKVDDRLTYRDKQDGKRVGPHDEQHYTHVLYRLREQLYEFGLMDQLIRLRFVESLAYKSPVKTNATTLLLEKIAKRIFIQEYEPTPKPSEGKRLDDLMLAPRLMSHVAKYSIQPADTLNGPQKIVTHMYNHGYVNEWQAELDVTGTRMLLRVNLHGALVTEPQGQAVLGTCLHALFNGIQEELKKRFVDTNIQEVFSLRFIDESVDYNEVPRGVIELMQECVIAHFGEHCQISFNEDFNHKHTQTSPMTEKAAEAPVVASEPPSEVDPFDYSVECVDNYADKYVCGWLIATPRGEDWSSAYRIQYVALVDDAQMFVTLKPDGVSVSPENEGSEQLMRGCLQQLKTQLTALKLIRLSGKFFLSTYIEDSTGRSAMELDRWADTAREVFDGELLFVKMIGQDQAEQMFLHKDAQARAAWASLFNAIQSLSFDERQHLFGVCIFMNIDQPQTYPSQPETPMNLHGDDVYKPFPDIDGAQASKHFDFEFVVSEQNEDFTKGLIVVRPKGLVAPSRDFEFVVRTHPTHTLMLHLLHWTGAGTPDEQIDELFHGLFTTLVMNFPWLGTQTHTLIYATATPAAHPAVQDLLPRLQAQAKRVFGEHSPTLQLTLDMNEREPEPIHVPMEVKRVESGEAGELPTVVIGHKSLPSGERVYVAGAVETESTLAYKQSYPTQPEAFEITHTAQSEPTDPVFPSVEIKRLPSGCVHFESDQLKTLGFEVPARGHMIHNWYVLSNDPKQLVIELDPVVEAMARVSASAGGNYDPAALLHTSYLVVLRDVQAFHGEELLAGLYSSVVMRFGAGYVWIDASSDAFIAAVKDLDYWHNYNVVSLLQGPGASGVKVKFTDPSEPRAQDVPEFKLHSCAFDYSEQGFLGGMFTLNSPEGLQVRSAQVRQTEEGIEIRPFYTEAERWTPAALFSQSPGLAIAQLHGVVKTAVQHFLAVYRLHAPIGALVNFKFGNLGGVSAQLILAYEASWLFEALKKDAQAFLNEDSSL